MNSAAAKSLKKKKWDGGGDGGGGVCVWGGGGDKGSRSNSLICRTIVCKADESSLRLWSTNVKYRLLRELILDVI